MAKANITNTVQQEKCRTIKLCGASWKTFTTATRIGTSEASRSRPNAAAAAAARTPDRGKNEEKGPNTAAAAPTPDRGKNEEAGGKKTERSDVDGDIAFSDGIKAFYVAPTYISTKHS